MAAGGRGTLDPGSVRAMFDRIAGVYDAMNSLMTAGLHHRWRSRAADLADLAPGDRVLDVATGTGDLAIELARRVGPSGEVVGCDFSAAMLERARTKAAHNGGAAQVAPISFELADALALPYAADSFAAAAVGFGARNFADLDAGIGELVRVVRSGGRVVILEITAPTREPLASFYRVWFDQLVPALGRLAGDRAAYSYLPMSVKRFPEPQALAARMAAQGLEGIRYVVTAGGIIAIHVGTVA